MNTIVRLALAVIVTIFASGLSQASFAGKTSISVSFGIVDTESHYSSGGSSPGTAMFYTSTDSNGDPISHYVGTPNTSYFSEHHFANGNTTYVVGTACVTCPSKTLAFPHGDVGKDTVTMFTASHVNDTDMFVYDLGVHVNHADSIVHDGIWKIATNRPFGVGQISEHYVDQKAHGGLSVIVGSDCPTCIADVRFYSNGDGTYMTITTFKH